MITLIAAVARNGVIGAGNTIPWHVPADFKHFSATTRENVVIMGSKTWDSLPEKFRPLPKRHNIVVTRNKERMNTEHELAHERLRAGLDWRTQWCDSIDEAFEWVEMWKALGYTDDAEVFIIGGASLYEQTIDQADRLLISEIPMEPEGDTFFPEIGPEWEIFRQTEMDGFNLLEYKRKS